MSAEVSDVWPRGIPVRGQRATLSRVFTRREIDLFDQISGDINPLHHDAEQARITPIGGICLQSGVSTAIFNRILSEQLPGPWTFFLKVEWEYRAPVRPDEEITGVIEVLEVRRDKPITRLRSQILGADGTVALDGTILAYTHPAPAHQDGVSR